MKMMQSNLKKVIRDLKACDYKDWDVLPGESHDSPNLWQVVSGRGKKFIFRTKPTGKTFYVTYLEGDVRDEGTFHEISLSNSKLTLTNNISKVEVEYTLSPA